MQDGLKIELNAEQLDEANQAAIQAESDRIKEEMLNRLRIVGNPYAFRPIMNRHERRRQAALARKRR